MTLCTVMDADTSCSNTPGLASLYLVPGMSLDILETMFNNADVHVQSDFLMYLINTGGPVEADLANFASLGKAHLYKGYENYDKHYSLHILCQHQRCDMRILSA